MHHVLPFRFNHIGLISDQPRAGEIFNPGTGVYVTDPQDSPYAIEWLRFSPEAAQQWGPLAVEPHICFEVDDIEAAVAGRELLYAPFDYIDGIVRAAFIVADGAYVEFIQYLRPDQRDLWALLRQQVAMAT
jgi:hypothetical protein